MMESQTFIVMLLQKDTSNEKSLICNLEHKMVVTEVIIF